MKPLIAFLVLSTAAYAEPSHHWGESSATLQLGPAPAAASVLVTNGPTYTVDNTLEFSLSVEGMTVDVLIDQGNGFLPDTYTIIPPEGYMVHPRSLSIDEGGDGTFEIYSLEGVGV